ncbi:AbiH family protein [uncultured Chitinophaga sp.]|uniref:AbiH family protein n=1 Tax=uncultured Chitinophaga sp. TaxID=339340 RepID=UPI0026397C32|nr:AbiH family protein [uncultured Chitinophaga sp.]
MNALFDGTLPDYRENNLDVVVHSKFFKILLEKCHIQNWVEIENEFYKELKRLLEAGKSIDISNDLNELNISMQSIIEAMQLYLSELKCLNEDQRFAEIFMLPISFDEIPEINQMKYVLPKETLILNFNYTNTVNRYLKELVKIPGLSFKVNNIHGELGNYENPIVFGFGDELDEDYKLMEKSSTKGFFKYIKSFWYFKTENYHNLIRFIQSDDFQVIILGHSCGLSDRTMLNMIFEHDNCKSIKIYYHQYSNNDNYTDLTEEISRHFSNKTAMRAKLIPKPLCSRMPQANPIKNEKLSDN